MKPISTFVVKPSLPKALQGLEALAYNLRWAWDPDTMDLFRRIDPILWETVYHNPVRMLNDISQERLNQLSENPGFLAHFKRVSESLRAFMDGETYFHSTHGKTASDIQIAYFSAEFGLTESLPIYSGGLGVLAGDHLKSASTLGLPFAAVGLLYQHGYFRQYLTNDGWQQEEYIENDYYALPVQIVRDERGRDVIVTLEYPEGEARVRIWKVQVGRIPLYLLDTNLMENPPSIREITAQLYGGDSETRIRQEILLGIGGVRALNACGIQPTVCHMNEGHSAFLGLERIRQEMHNKGATFDQAAEYTSAGHVFTTHTPVPAGHDVFPVSLIEKYFSSYAHELGLSMSAFLALGQGGSQRASDGFNMTVLAFNLSSYRNGVSKLHGEVSRTMWQSLWPGLPKNEIPIASITNGVHIASHISQQMRALEDNYMGPRRLEEPHDQSVWETIDHIPPEELWRVHERRRERLVAFARQRLRMQLQRETASSIDMARADEVLTSDALTIGFARRFATYKRATLLFHDLERLTRILCNEERPVQVIFAGKAHPQDHAGKEFIQEIFGLTQREYLHRRLVFIENYDMCVARFLVQGVDIWLNTPMRPQEASGTSGMKAVANGALNLSVLDGWWAEAYQPELGWEIGHGKEYDDPAYQNQIEARAIYNILEKEAVPLFYDRGVDGLPRGWIARMKNAMRVLCPKYNTHRMVQEYTERFYLKAHARSRDLSDSDGARARALAEWKNRVHQAWRDVAIRSVTSSQTQTSHVGDKIEIRADVALGDLTVEDVAVEIFHGQVGTEGQIVQGESLSMMLVDSHTFVGRLPLQKSGRWGYTVRIRPHHQDLNSISDTGLITWA